MKNLNLIKRLWTDSHEKQSLQRFARYAAMLIMLLTLGVGQMWAAISYSGGYIYFDNSLGINSTTLQLCARQDKGGGSYWTGVSSLSNISNTKLYYVANPQGSGWGGILGWVVISANPAKSSSDFDNWSSYTWCSNWNTYGFYSGSTYLIVPSSISKSQSVKTTYYSGGYSALNSTQTINTVVKTGSGSYTSANSKATISITSYAMTGNGAVTKQSTSLSTSASSQTVSAARTATTTYTVGDVASGYQFDGWYTAATGGTQLSSSKTYTYYPTAATTVYARFSEKMSTVTITASPSGKGSFTIGGAAATSTTAGVTTTRSVTAVPISGYHFVSWAISGGATISSTTTNPTTVTGGGAGTAATLTATFEADAVNSLTVEAGTHVTTVTGSTSPVTLGNKYAINATAFETGWQFLNWTATPAANGTFDNASSASTNVTVKNGSVVVTANAREKMTTVTVNVSPSGAGTLTLDASAFTPGNTTTAGVATSRTVVATPTSGKVFHDWTVTGNATGSASTNTYTLEGNGNAGTGTLTANFGIASGWYMEGIDFGGWNRGTAAYQLTYSYREMDGVVYYPTTLTKDHYWKVNNGTTPYSINSTSSPAIVKGTIYPIAEEWSYSTYASSTMNNVWVVVDKGTNKKLWVQDPQTFHNVNVTGADNAKGPVKVTLKTTSAFTKGDNVFETTQFANGETFTITVTPVTGYIPTITIGGNTPVTWWKEQATYTADGTMSTSDITVTISYTPTRAVTFAKTTGCNSLSATGPSSTAVTTGTKVKDGIVIRFAQTNSTGYTFSKWYSNTTGTDGTQYSASSSAYDLTISSTAYTIYPLYTENMTTVNLVASPAGKGTFSCGGNTVTSVSAGVTTHPVVTAVAGSGYRVNTSATVWSESSDYISISPANAATTTITATGTSGNSATLTATFTPKTYTITLHEQGATTHGTPGDGGTITATYDATTNLSKITAVPERTGYTFGGYYDTEECDGTWIIKTDTYFNWDGTYINSSTGVWKYDGNVDLYAKWTANQYTVTLDVDEANKGTIAGATTSQNIYYGDATVTVPNRPTAANGYALDGYYTKQLGAGTKVINADGTWIASVEGYTNASKHWIHAEDVTLYAYYKKAEITALTLDAATVESNGTVYVKPTIDPTPTGTTKLSWYILYANGNKLASQPTISGPTDGKYSFTAPEASGMYIIAASLRTGTGSHPYYGGTLLDSTTVNFQVAGTHTVTVRYKCGGEDIKAATALDGIRPLDWSDEITAPDIIGYSFTDWTAGDGVSLTDDNGTTTKTSTTEADIKIKAIYDGYLTANYSKKRIIYFNNTLNWENVYVYFYKNGTYWDATYGTGCNGTYQYTDYPFSEGLYGQMLPVEEGSKIYYFDAEAAGVNASYQTVVFTELDQHTYNWFSKTGNVKNKVIKRDDYYSTKMPMYVPLAVQTPDSKNGNNADYYWQGYWMNYPENTGYTLKIYNKKTRSDAPDAGSKDPVELKSIPFEFTADKTMPMELDVDLEAGQTYGFKIYRNDGLNTGAGSFYGNGGTMTANSEGWDMKTGKANCGLQTTAAGNYKFVLNFYEISSDYQYRVSVTYPVAVGDYRIVYTDGATWSGSAHGASWNHPSGVIAKNSSATETKKDTVSFFWSYGSTPAIKYQTCTAVAAGSASWNAGTSIDVSGFSSVLTKEGVYNFIFEQPADGASISLIKVEPYTGNFYIRTDCAGSTKWANFRSLDHQMTYSDYAEVNSGYSHYYTHWVTNGTNVKFCIANDYSQCITDTLTQDYGTTIANIDAAGALNSASANIRFMWNQSTNKVSRAYIGGSTNISERFLVLEGDAKMFDENGNPLNITGLNPNEANLIDVQNFVYERTIQVNTKARAKLTAKYNNNIQYFKGSEGTFADGTTIELLGGDAIGKHTMRIVYDFKTNRLVTAYVPSGTIDDDIAINADLMIVREHQGAGQQLLFEGDGAALSKVHTVYGVMRFNRWTLNNKEKTGGHSPVGDPKSIYERSLYWISFPFNVNLSDVFGFGTYGVDWIIEYYDGAERATNGYWIDSDGFWKMVMPAQRATFTLEAGKGYVLAIDIDAMKDNNKTFWANNIEQVELFFPSATNVENITQTTAHTTVPEHECTIDRRTDKSVNNINKDRTKADSHWNMIGIPSYANYGATLTSDEKGTHTITWNSNPYTNDLPFLYEWNMTDDSYTVQSGTTYPFKAMHSYMVQYHGDLYWSLASATPTPSPIVARRAYAEKPQNAEFRLELQQNEKMVDQTFVNMKDAEEISAGFKFDEDLCKEFNAGKANIYTLIENYLPAAGNTLPMSDQTTLVPVGVKTTAAGEYTFAMPEGTSGVSVVLIDNIAGTRTNLALSDYTVTLSKGDLSDRFMLEIAPIKQMPTDIENVQGDNVHSTKVRKVMIDGILYIVKDGKVFDARGAKVK